MHVSKVPDLTVTKPEVKGESLKRVFGSRDPSGGVRGRSPPKWWLFNGFPPLKNNEAVYRIALHSCLSYTIILQCKMVLYFLIFMLHLHFTVYGDFTLLHLSYS